jgi:glycosyltransferase involved in cell wall biosynthesis
VKRVVFVTQQFDPAHPLLATTIPQVAALARQVDELVVVADKIVESALPENGRGRSFSSPTKAGRGARLIEAVAQEQPALRRDHGAVIVHMCPVYALLSAPIVRGSRLPLVMWWVHWKIDRVVIAAERVCTAVCTVDPRTFPMQSKKLHALGQGIDMASFPLAERVPPPAGAPLRVLVGSRYSPAKGIEVILRATRIALDGGLDLQVLVHGPAGSDEERREQERLKRLRRELELEEHVKLGGPVLRSDVLRLLGEADVLVNNARGGADRIAYEAAASRIPVLASNPAYSSLLDPELFFDRDDPAGLAARLGEVEALSPAQRGAVGDRLRERVEQLHSTDSWSTGLLRAAGLA